ncbi:MAG: hypothetical protein P8X65_06940 [Syntrophobacterales bacterium]
MASKEAGKGGQTFSSILRFLKIFTLNLWRRLLMLGHYTVICFHQQRLRCAWRVLGRQVHQALDNGEVNPILAEEVKDSLAKAQDLKAAKERHYQAIAALREKIQASRAEEPSRVEEPSRAEEPTPPPEAEPAPPSAETEPAAAEKPEPIILGEPEPTPAPEPEAETPKEPEPEKPQD